MGQHKNNLTAQLAKAGMLPSKKEKIPKRQLERELNQEIAGILISKALRRAMGSPTAYGVF